MTSNIRGLRAGVAELDITPPAGIALTGYVARDGHSIGIHDRLYAKCLVLETETQQVAVIVCDVLGLDKEFVASLRSEIEAATGLSASNIMILCTHTHSGPATMFLRRCGEVDQEWKQVLHRRLVDVCQQAWAKRLPAKIGAGQGHVTQGVHNRRRRGDPVDPALGVLRIEDEHGTPMAVLLNFACHPTCLGPDNRLISADYPGYAADIVQAETGAVTLFATGAIGDVGPLGNGYPVAATLGNAVAAEALQVLDRISMQDGASLTAQRTRLDLPLQVPPDAKDLTQIIDESKRLLDQAQRPNAVPLAMVEWAETTLAALQADQIADSVPAEVHMIALDSIALVGVPGEFFTELGLAIKRRASSDHLFVCGFANDNIGYIPTRHAYRHGGYEICVAYKYYGYPAALAPEAGEQIVETALQLVQTHHSQEPTYHG